MATQEEITSKVKEAIQQYKEHFKKDAQDTLVDDKNLWEKLMELTGSPSLDPKTFSKDINKISGSKIINYKLQEEAIKKLANANPTGFISALRNLYNESSDADLEHRITTFKEKINALIEPIKYEIPNWENRNVNDHLVSLFLTLRYPDKYTLYSENSYKLICYWLGNRYNIKSKDKLIHYTNFLYDIVLKEVKKETEFIEGINKEYHFNNALTLAYLIIKFACTNNSNNNQNNNESIEDTASEEDSNQIEPLQMSVNTDKKYWWLLGNPKIFSFSDVKVGETMEWTLYNDTGSKRRVFQNYLDAKVGDKVFCYQASPVLQIVALAEVSRENDGQEIVFKKVENLLNPIDYSEIRNNPSLGNMEFMKNPNGSFFKVTLDEAAELMDVIRAENPIRQEAKKYAKQDFINEVYMSDTNYERLSTLLESKKNIILQGAPGVGKTFSAKRLAYSILGKEDDSHVEVVQFHQNYSYEDFIMGYKPTENGGFELKKGLFYTFCKKAAADTPNSKYFFIIDEINRGNLSKIFGELLMLIENDYRGKEIRLAYNGESFSVPKNVYLIGMMNTADRSLAMIDYALRRRFSFFEITPGFDSDGFKKLHSNIDNEKFDKLIEAVKVLNEQIAKDNSLGSGFCIGHSYFCNPEGDIEQWLRNIVDYDINPMLKEYWFDNEEKYKVEIEKLRDIFK